MWFSVDLQSEKVTLDKEDDSKSIRGNRCLCDSARLNVSGRLSFLKAVYNTDQRDSNDGNDNSNVDDDFDWVTGTPNGLRKPIYENLTAYITSSFKLGSEDDANKDLDRFEYSGNQETRMKLENIQTCSPTMFHGFKNELTCGRILNTVIWFDTSIFAIVIILSGCALFLLFYTCISSICLRRCLFNKNWCRKCCCCKKCDSEKHRCCVRRCGRHPDDLLHDAKVERMQNKRRFSQRRSSFTSSI